EILKKLVLDTDIFVENYRTGALDKLGLGYNDLKELNPTLIYCSLSGFGDKGPKAKVNAYDNVIQATSGIIDQSAGHKPGVSFVDYAAGYNAAFAISAALHQRAQTGEGTYISTSMLEVAMTLMAPEAAAAAYPVKVKRDKEAGISSYETTDGILMMGAFTPDQNRRLWKVIEDSGYKISNHLKDTDDWESLWAKSKEIRSELQNILKDKTAAKWQDIFHQHSLPAERHRSLAEAIEDPQLRNYFHQSEMAEGDKHAPILPKAAFAFKNGAKITSPPPGFGEHTAEILKDLGYSTDEIVQLKEKGVIA
ncbi:MAG: CoA transferase, partial [Kordiimonadaceae bacterium]|nr:CoA transferase [Kordiimonadaceae bacterium]